MDDVSEQTCLIRDRTTLISSGRDDQLPQTDSETSWMSVDEDSTDRRLFRGNFAATEVMQLDAPGYLAAENLENLFRIPSDSLESVPTVLGLEIYMRIVPLLACEKVRNFVRCYSFLEGLIWRALRSVSHTRFAD